MPFATINELEATYLRNALGSLALATDTLQDLRQKFYTNPPTRVGSGSPEGVVTAPVGTLYNDLANTLGAYEWVKLSGAGNTGWVVLAGDTGFRKVTAAGSASITGTFMLRRVDYTVDIVFGDDVPQLTGDATIVSGDSAYTLPVGFRPHVSRRALYGQGGGALAKLCAVSQGGIIQFFSAPAVSSSLQGSFTYQTKEAWPAALPGVAA